MSGISPWLIETLVQAIGMRKPLSPGGDGLGVCRHRSPRARLILQRRVNRLGGIGVAGESSRVHAHLLQRSSIRRVGGRLAGDTGFAFGLLNALPFADCCTISHFWWGS